jgi:hypothetical protein
VLLSGSNPLPARLADGRVWRLDEMAFSTLQLYQAGALLILKNRGLS